jgi:hypothetical protein
VGVPATCTSVLRRSTGSLGSTCAPQCALPGLATPVALDPVPVVPLLETCQDVMLQRSASEADHISTQIYDSFAILDPDYVSGSFPQVTDASYRHN